MSTNTLRDALKEARIWLVGAGGATCRAVQNIDRALADTKDVPPKQEATQVTIPKGLIAALREAANVLSGQAERREPLADELEGFAYMLSDTVTPKQEAAPLTGQQAGAMQDQKDAARYRELRTSYVILNCYRYNQVSGLLLDFEMDRRLLAKSPNGHLPWETVRTTKGAS